jgi:hypothetical protein
VKQNYIPVNHYICPQDGSPQLGGIFGEKKMTSAPHYRSPIQCAEQMALIKKRYKTVVKIRKPKIKAEPKSDRLAQAKK